MLDMKTFTHVAVHDLKAPMNGIASLVGFFAEDYGEQIGAAGREDLRLLQRLAERGVALVDGLKMLTRVSEAALAPRPVAMREASQRAVAAVELRWEGLRVSPGPRSDLPAAQADPALVSILLEQLVLNAVTFKSGPDCFVEIGHEAGSPARDVPSDHVVFFVRDRGIGIPAKHHEEIFDMFKRLNGPDAFAVGAGGGLAIARQIVERHGGSMWLQSEEGQGATFHFTLPAALHTIF